MRRSMHLGDERRLPVEEEEEVVEEELFNPEAAKADDNPFPEEVVEEVVEEEPPVEEEVVEEPSPDYESMTVEELRALCRARELAVNGKKADIIARLKEADAPSEEAVEATTDAPSEEAASSDEKEGDVSNAPDERTNDVG